MKHFESLAVALIFGALMSAAPVRAAQTATGEVTGTNAGSPNSVEPLGANTSTQAGNSNKNCTRRRATSRITLAWRGPITTA